MSSKLANLLFPKIEEKVEDIENRFPKRTLKEGAKVTRLGPSPTGFIHLGNLYGAFVDERLATQSQGVFYLRIEDTDDKRYVEGGVEAIMDALGFFGITFTEGATPSVDLGEYGPYRQSERKAIYQTYVKTLVERGAAYPCFMTEEEIAQIRADQENEKLTPGIYGEYAKSRNLSYDEIEDKIKSGEEYVIRLASKGVLGEDAKRIEVADGIRGNINMPENFQDVVILKKNGIPTYHFAHAIDDHLMGTTHVVRGEEWLSTLPIHVELFETLGFEKPVYCHTAQLMKVDENGNKRKLSKRLDPELSLEFYKQEGYHKEAIREYLLTILNSNYEEWRIENPENSSEEFAFTLDKMSKSGTLFDLNKLKDVSKDTLLRIEAKDLKQFILEWAKEYEEDFYQVIFKSDLDLEKILDIGRNENKPRKDLVYGKQIKDHIAYFYEEYFKIENELPQEVLKEDAVNILEKYLESYDQKDDQQGWFEKIRNFAPELGYAQKPKDFKKNPEDYKGHVGHVSTIIRLAITGKTQSPDIWEIQQILGENQVVSRLKKYMESFK